MTAEFHPFRQSPQDAKMIKANPSFRLGAALVLAWTLLIVAPSALAQDVSTGQVAAMTDALVEMLPFGRVLDDAAAHDPAWPMQQKANAVTVEQLACLRQELSSEGYRRSKHAAVEAYAKANPSRFAGDLKLLDGGAATMFGKLVRTGFAKKDGDDSDTDTMSVLKSSSSEELLSFMTFFSDPEYAQLRTLSGIGNSLDINKSSAENEAIGQGLGSSMVMKLMISAMASCNVPPSAIF
jgi:hypothetical protein